MKVRLALSVTMLSLILFLSQGVLGENGEGDGEVNIEETDDIGDIYHFIPAPPGTPDEAARKEKVPDESVSDYSSIDIVRVSVTPEGKDLNFSITIGGPLIMEPDKFFTFHINSTATEQDRFDHYSVWFRFEESLGRFDAWVSYTLPEEEQTEELKYQDWTMLFDTYGSSGAIYVDSFTIKVPEGLITTQENWMNIAVESHLHELLMDGNLSEDFYYDNVYLTTDSPPAAGTDGGDGDTDGGDGDIDGGDGDTDGGTTDGGDGETDGGASEGGAGDQDGDDGGDDGLDLTMLLVIIALLLVFILLFAFTLSQKMKIDREMEEVRKRREERRKDKGGKGGRGRKGGKPGDPGDGKGGDGKRGRGDGGKRKGRKGAKKDKGGGGKKEGKKGAKEDGGGGKKKEGNKGGKDDAGEGKKKEGKKGGKDDAGEGKKKEGKKGGKDPGKKK